MAKEAFNGIDPTDVKRSYRYEQGYTFELNLSGVSDRLRESFGTAAPGTGNQEGQSGG
jgi:enoyl-CoA hydratase